MKTMLRIALTASTLLIAGAALAAPRTATLEVENMSCVACAPIVKNVLSRISGVSQVAVVERAGVATATVTFDDEKVTPAALAQAVSNAGFPATVKGVKSAMATTPNTRAASR